MQSSPVADRGFFPRSPRLPCVPPPRLLRIIPTSHRGRLRTAAHRDAARLRCTHPGGVTSGAAGHHDRRKIGPRQRRTVDEPVDILDVTELGAQLIIRVEL